MSRNAEQNSTKIELAGNITLPGNRVAAKKSNSLHTLYSIVVLEAIAAPIDLTVL